MQEGYTETKNITPSNHVSLVTKFAGKYSVDPNKLLSTLKQTAFKLKTGEVSNEQMMALLVVADQYGLNPFTKEIYAFPDKNGAIVPVVGIDGWIRIANNHPEFNGMEFLESGNSIKADADAKLCPDWMEVKIFRKDRDHPVVVREYLDETYRPPYQDGNYKKSGPWQSHTKRMHRHKTMIQGFRIAFGFSGIYDEDEAERIVEGVIIEHGTPESEETASMNSTLKEEASKARESSSDNQPAVDMTDSTGNDSLVTIIDVNAKIKLIEAKHSKKKLTKADITEINELVDEATDLASSVVKDEKALNEILDKLKAFRIEDVAPAKGKGDDKPEGGEK